MNRHKKVIEAAEVALLELDKVIRQKINLVELEPEKAKIAAQAKWVAIEDSFKIIEKIEELSENKKQNKESIKFLGVEKSKA